LRRIGVVVDVVLGTKLISMTPYKTSTFELGKLKKLLEDTQRNRFVKPSVLFGEL
jgi:hypothetical protein